MAPLAPPGAGHLDVVPRGRSGMRWFLAASLFSAAGGAAVEVLLPIIAVVDLRASVAQVAALSGTILATSLLLQIPCGAVADRVGCRVRPMVYLSLARVLLVPVVPLLSLVGELTLHTLLAWTAMYVAVLALASSLGHGIINALSEPEGRIRAIGVKNAVSESGRVVGQSLGPSLIAVVSGPASLLFSAVTSTLASFALARLARDAGGALREADAAGPAGRTTSASEEKRASWSSIITGVLSCRPMIIAWLVGGTSGIVGPVEAIYAIRGLGIHPAVIGVLTAAGTLGAVGAGALTGRLHERFGMRAVLTTGVIAMSAGLLAFGSSPARPPWSAAAFASFEALTAFGGTLVVATGFGALQQKTPLHVIGRTMTLSEFVMQTAGLAAVVVGGSLGGRWGGPGGRPARVGAPAGGPAGGAPGQARGRGVVQHTVTTAGGRAATPPVVVGPAGFEPTTAAV